MRDALAARVGQRLHLQATVGRFGVRPVYRNIYEQTLLLLHPTTLDGDPLCDHVWMPVGVRLAALDPQPGDVVTFTARVKPYQKCRIYRRRRNGVVKVSSSPDYTLAYPGQIRKISTAQGAQT